MLHGKSWALRTMLFRGVGDAAACRCGIVVVRRKNAGAGWRAGFEAALRGLADLIPRPGLLLTLLPRCVCSCALQFLVAGENGRGWSETGKSTLGGCTLEESGSVTFAAHGRGQCTGTWGKAHENTCRCRMKRRGPCPGAWVRQRELGRRPSNQPHTPLPPHALVGPAPLPKPWWPASSELCGLAPAPTSRYLDMARWWTAFCFPPIKATAG